MNIQALAEKFCATVLPSSVSADPCATDPSYPHARYGTNLLTVKEARLVLGCVLGGESCTWEEDADGVWYSCPPDKGGRNAFTFDDGDIEENKFYFCPSCGKPIVAVPYANPADMDAL